MSSVELKESPPPYVLPVSQFTTSQSTEKLDEALAAAQGEIDKAIKEKTNPHFRSKYADLAAVWEACRDALTRQKVHVTQWPLHSDDGRLHLVTRLSHAGQWMQGHFSLPVQKQDAHGYGSAVTYARRFALSAAVGVVPDEDDDGNASVQKGSQKQTRSKKQQKPPEQKTEVGKKEALILDIRQGVQAIHPKGKADAETIAKERSTLLRSVAGVDKSDELSGLSMERLTEAADKLDALRQELAGEEPGWMQGESA